MQKHGKLCMVVMVLSVVVCDNDSTDADCGSFVAVIM